MVEILPHETALIVIDPQNGMCHPQGTLGESGIDTTRLMAIIPRLAELVTACRAVGIPDLWTRHYNLAEDRAREARRIMPHTKKRKRIACQPGTWDSEFVDDLKPLAESAARVIEKYRWSAFHATTLDTLLHALGTRLVVVSGTTQTPASTLPYATPTRATMTWSSSRTAWPACVPTGRRRRSPCSATMPPRW
ncbi:MAG: isochorismatase family cysteine hydrolase [Rhodospirillales bacterium]|nr:isochorismatase family cysteine hydrolase [Rhodospirillales bacterium]HJO72453.1 isochorismatase family cysteine hydrolase [Rhodospirillales bacterium]